MRTNQQLAVSAGLSRRTLLRRGASLVALATLPGALAACGGGGPNQAAAKISGKVGGKLQYLGWEGEDYPKVLAAWKKKTGVTIASSYIGSMSDIPPKFANRRGKGTDLIDYSSSGTGRLLGSGVPLAPLEIARLKNHAGLVPYFRDDLEKNFQNADGKPVSIPLLWGAIGIVYDSKAIAEPTAWADLFKPEMKGKITVFDDPSTNFGMAARILGFKADQLTQDQFSACKEYMTKLVGQAKQITASYGDMTNLLASGEVVAAWGGYSAVVDGAAAAGSKNIKINLQPKEGTGCFSQCVSISGTSDNAITAYAYIDELLDPATNQAAGESLGLVPTVEVAADKVAKTIAADYPIDNLAEFFKTAPMIKDPPAQSTDFVTFGEITEAWTQIKSAA